MWKSSKKANGAYPDSWAVQNYEAVYLLKAAVEKAKTIETDAVVKAIEGMTFEGLRQGFSIRALDHMGTVPCYQGTIAKDPKYPFKDLEGHLPDPRRSGHPSRGERSGDLEEDGGSEISGCRTSRFSDYAERSDKVETLPRATSL